METNFYSGAENLSQEFMSSDFNIFFISCLKKTEKTDFMNINKLWIDFLQSQPARKVDFSSVNSS